MKTLQKLDKHVIYLNELVLQVASHLKHPDDVNCAERAVRSVLITIRNCLSFEQSIKFINYLPLPFKAIYIQDWHINDKVPERIHSMNEFIEQVYKLDAGLCSTHYKEHDAIKQAVKAVFKVIGLHISNADLQKELAFLPDDLRLYLEAEGVSIKSNEIDSSIWLS